MFGFTSRRHHHPHTTATTTTRTHRRGFFHRTNPNRRAAGLKGALHNPNTSTTGRSRAKHELRSMGRGREAHVPLSVRIKHMLGIRSHRHHAHRY